MALISRQPGVGGRGDLAVRNLVNQTVQRRLQRFPAVSAARREPQQLLLILLLQPAKRYVNPST
jgi:hypothetical protein